MANVPESPDSSANLTPGAAFIVHLAVRPADAATTAATAQGRVEHVLSGTAADFNSIADLVAFMGETIARCQRGERTRPPANAGAVRGGIMAVDTS